VDQLQSELDSIKSMTLIMSLCVCLVPFAGTVLRAAAVLKRARSLSVRPASVPFSLPSSTVPRACAHPH